MTRELTVINMLVGQLLNEQLNNIIKELIKEERPLSERTFTVAWNHILTNTQKVMVPDMASHPPIANG